MPKPSDAKDPKDRLLSSIAVDHESGCWNWTGSVVSEDWPYGRITVGSRTDGTRKVWRAHRLSYTLFKGDIEGGLLVCHTCDNPRCVNPGHLFLGTTKENADDRDAKGRNILPKLLTGEKSPKAKLKNADALAIRVSTKPVRDLAAAYGVGERHIRYIKSGKHFLEDVGGGA